MVSGEIIYLIGGIVGVTLALVEMMHCRPHPVDQKGRPLSWHNEFDHACVEFLGDMRPKADDRRNRWFDGTPIPVSERRCLVCRPYVEEQVDAVLRGEDPNAIRLPKKVPSGTPSRLKEPFGLVRLVRSLARVFGDIWKGLREVRSHRKTRVTADFVYVTQDRRSPFLVPDEQRMLALGKKAAIEKAERDAHRNRWLARQIEGYFPSGDDVWCHSCEAWVLLGHTHERPSPPAPIPDVHRTVSRKVRRMP